MNILPKKRWHVRTKDNIARVRRDEAEAAEQERKRIEKLEYAENEARLNILRAKAGATGTSKASSTEPTQGKIITNDGHVDLFSDFQSHIKTINKEHEKEKKEEKEKYEKQIGYLTYLGQDTNEALKLRSWYELPPDRTDVYDRKIVEKDLKTKYLNDPLTLIKTLLPEEKKIPSKVKSNPAPEHERKEVLIETPEKLKKPKKDKKHKKDKKKKKKKEKHSRNEEKLSEERTRKNELIDRLRKERLKREARERARQEELLCPKVEKPKVVEEVRPGPRIVQKYNSQFNPELAKQNMA